MHPVTINNCKLWSLQIESGSLLMLGFWLMSRYLRCFNLAMLRGKVSNVAHLKSKTRKHLNFARHVFSISSQLAPATPIGNITVLTAADFLVTKLLNKILSAKDRCRTLSEIFSMLELTYRHSSLVTNMARSCTKSCILKVNTDP
ncbi:hypothetical protein V8G54_019031 [Vigna mungo]|uniref:Uncharacterized protein n=1 Tax=Vigna mungo TaxID=3915 RepID=A0AAQ3N983_VIGMU